MNGHNGATKGQLKTLPIRKAALIKHFAKSGNLTESLAKSGLSRSTHYRLLEINPKYAEAFQEASNAATDILVKEARRRAVEGDVEPTGWYKGKPGGYVTRRSDNLLMFVIKKERPEYRDKWEVTGAGGQPIQVLVANYAAPDPGKKPEPKTVPAIEGTATNV